MQALRWDDGTLLLLNQTLLPAKTEWISCTTVERVREAIQRLETRGAPAIGVAAAFGLVLAAKQSENRDEFHLKVNKLKEARPTAVNLMWAIDRLLASTKETSFDGLAKKLEEEAQILFAEDLAMNKQIGIYGAQLFSQPISILTHCNTGSLATAGYGTALGVIRRLWEEKKLLHVYADETRPLLQGARLTAYELHSEGIPATLITDSMAGWVMKNKMVQAVIVGADRIARNGDTANKIGTYSLAILAKEHQIPFYVAAPYSTFDLTIATGDEIPIEERASSEVNSFNGALTAPEGISVFNPAFDVTPNKYITGIITDKGVLTAPYESQLKKWEEI